MNWFVALFGALGAVCWIGAVVSWIKAIRRRRKGVKLSMLLTSGMAAFDKNNFRDEGQKYRRWMTGFFVGFFLCLFAAATFGILHATTDDSDEAAPTTQTPEESDTSGSETPPAPGPATGMSTGMSTDMSAATTMQPAEPTPVPPG